MRFLFSGGGFGSVGHILFLETLVVLSFHRRLKGTFIHVKQARQQ